MRISPAKWDAEYSWNRNEGVHAGGTSPLILLPERQINGGRKTMPTALRRAGQVLRGAEGGNGTIIGLALQVLGAFVLMFVLGADGFLPLLSLGAVLFGEVIFISSLTHKGVRSRGERIK